MRRRLAREGNTEGGVKPVEDAITPAPLGSPSYRPHLLHLLPHSPCTGSLLDLQHQTSEEPEEEVDNSSLLALALKRFSEFLEAKIAARGPVNAAPSGRPKKRNPKSKNISRTRNKPPHTPQGTPRKQRVGPQSSNSLSMSTPNSRRTASVRQALSEKASRTPDFGSPEETPIQRRKLRRGATQSNIKNTARREGDGAPQKGAAAKPKLQRSTTQAQIKRTATQSNITRRQTVAPARSTTQATSERPAIKAGGSLAGGGGKSASAPTAKAPAPKVKASAPRGGGVNIFCCCLL